MAIFLIPSLLRSYTNNQLTIEIAALNMKEAFYKLIQQCPLLKNVLFDENGRLVVYVNVFIDELPLSFGEYDSIVIKKDSMIRLVPALVGG